MLSIAMSDYRLTDIVPEAVQTELREHSSFLQQLLYNRGITDAAAAQQFLNPSYDEHLHDPWLMPGMQAAVGRIETALGAQEMIAIFSDYDCDGIPGAVVLHDFFKAIDAKHFTNYIPHRHYEGFGLSEAAVEKRCHMV